MPTTEPTTLRYRCGTKGAFYEVVCTVCTVSGATSRPLVVGPYRSEEAALRGFNQHVACIHHHNMLKIGREDGLGRKTEGAGEMATPVPSEKGKENL